MKIWTKSVAMLFLLAFGMPASVGIILDLTPNVAAFGVINGAIYTNGIAGSGTGTFPAFVRLQDSPTERGFNTTANTVSGELMDNTGGDPFNHAIYLGDIPLVLASNGTYYRVFALDTHESGGQAGNELVSLDDVQIFINGTADNTSAGFDANGVLTAPGIGQSVGTLIYRMDFGASGTDNWVAITDAFSSGSGTSDNFLYVPNSLFGGSTTTTAGAGPNVILYSQFGLQGVMDDGASNLGGVPDGDYSTTATCEEWALGFAPSPPPVLLEAPALPEPTSMVAWGLGLLCCGAARLRRKPSSV